ncbi:MAG: TlpA disulfide reductase family protein [Candidatus Sumerlaeia bacterium]|nr:TlpA disulfide reductase family protein [Candidatus Sumerlaeia bacterium]
MNKSRWILVALILPILLATFALNAQSRTDVPAGLKLANLKALDLEGNEVALSKYQGKVVLLDVWATWCGPCVKQRPILKQLAEKHGEKLVILPVSVDDDPKTVKAFIEKHGGKATELYYTEQLIKDIGGANSIPTFVVFDKAGDAKAKMVGGRSLEAWEELLKDHLG